MLEIKKKYIKKKLNIYIMTPKIMLSIPKPSTNRIQFDVYFSAFGPLK